MTTLGFVGTGHITAAMVEGFCSAPESPERIVVSPRNPEKAEALRRRFASVTVGADNQAVVDASEIVFLAVRPPIASEVAGALRFRADHIVVSLVALHPEAEMRRLIRPAQRLIRAVPLPSSAHRIGPIAYYPRDAAIERLFARIGTPIAAGSERQFHRLWSLTGLIAPYCTLVAEIARWTEEGGVAPESAEAYLKSFMHCLAMMTMEAPFERLAREAATPGGINEQALTVIKEGGGFAAFRAALDAVNTRMNRTLG
jgi:pyrroline-5-carboxylate reductase